MPAIYAHRAFGEDLKKRLPPERFAEVFAHPDCFALGLHGPDTLFYFHPLGKNAVNLRGEELHKRPAREFFFFSLDTLTERGASAADIAYLYGFVCHFALDSVCHPEVAAQMKEHSLSHTAVEAAFEREMLLRDQKEPVRAVIADHIRATQENISAVSAYCGVTPCEAKKCIRSMVRSSRLLRAPDALRRAILRFALRIAGSRSVIDMIIPERDTPKKKAAAQALSAAYERALGVAVALLENFRAFLAGEATLDERFSSNFDTEELA